MELRIIISNTTDPYVNVAVENYLMSLPADDSVTMYLWKNRRTVVVGKNQNPFAECNVDLLKSEDGRVMRRTTGGGAVYHDDGNINFSFVTTHDHYNLQRQFSVIKEAINRFGLHAETSGRNDLLCDGRKFSGNAFSKTATRSLHHGTILIKSNVSDLNRYLKVSETKLHKHGVASVQSRVVNLSELADVTSENIVPQLVAAFEQVYGQSSVVVDFEDLKNNKRVLQLVDTYSNDAWIYGKWRHFVATKKGAFGWGEVAISFDIDEEKAMINNIEIASDGLELDAIEQARQLLTGASTKEKPINDNPVVNDIVNLVYS